MRPPETTCAAAAAFVAARSAGAALDCERSGSRPGGARRTRAPPVVAEGSSRLGQDGLPDGLAGRGDGAVVGFLTDFSPCLL